MYLLEIYQITINQLQVLISTKFNTNHLILVIRHSVRRICGLAHVVTMTMGDKKELWHLCNTRRPPGGRRKAGHLSEQMLFLN